MEARIWTNGTNENAGSEPGQLLTSTQQKRGFGNGLGARAKRANQISIASIRLDFLMPRPLKIICIVNTLD